MMKLVEEALSEFVNCMNDKDVDVDSDTLGFILEDLINHNDNWDMLQDEFALLCEKTYEEAEKRGLLEGV